MTDADPTPPPGPGPGHESRSERARRTVAGIARIIEDRDEIVEDALTRLAGAGVIDDGQRQKAWDAYVRGDARTRRYVHDLVSRIMGGGTDRPDEVDAEGVQRSPDARAALGSLQDLAAGKATPPRSKHDSEDGANVLLRLLAAFPVKVLKVQRALIATGLALLVLVGAALAFPADARLVLFYGFLALVGIFGLFLVKWSFQMDRAMKRHGVDVKALSRLEPAERRILLVRRFLKRTFSSEKVATFVEGRMRDGRGKARKARRARQAEGPPAPKEA